MYIYKISRWVVEHARIELMHFIAVCSAQHTLNVPTAMRTFERMA